MRGGEILQQGVDCTDEGRKGGSERRSRSSECQTPFGGTCEDQGRELREESFRDPDTASDGGSGSNQTEEECSILRKVYFWAWSDSSASEGCIATCGNTTLSRCRHSQCFHSECSLSGPRIDTKSNCRGVQSEAQPSELKAREMECDTAGCLLSDWSEWAKNFALAGLTSKLPVA